MQASGIDLALLRVALQHSSEAPSADAEAKVKPEDYEWLREAMKSFETDAQKMQKLLEIVKKDNTEVSEEQKQAAFEELQFFVEDLDNATDFSKIGGLPITLQMIKESNTDTTKVWALWLLATAVQNHSEVQSAALSLGALDTTLSVLASTSNMVVKQKALLAIIGLTKENPQAQRTFLDNNGVSHLTSLLSHPDPPVRMKSAYFLSQLVTSNPTSLYPALRTPTTLAPLVAMVDDPNDDSREKAVTLLSQLADDAEVRAQCVALGVAGVARDRVRVIAQEVGLGSRTKEEAQEAMGVLMGLLMRVENKL